MVARYIRSLRLVWLPMLIMVVGQLSSKYGMILGLKTEDNKIYWFAALFVLIGYCCLILRGIVWINVLKKENLSIVYPMMSLVLVFIMILSHLLFDEQITGLKMLGMAFIIGGTFITNWNQEA